MSNVLQRLNVIELAGVLAGPAVGTFLAELGANVIKIESPQGDITRTWNNTREILNRRNPSKNNHNNSRNITAYFASVNYGKHYITLDMTKESQKDKLYEMIKTTDIVITNYKKGDDQKLGTDYTTLKKIKSDLIYASITGFGEESSRTAFDAVLQAETGYMSMNGTIKNGGMPLKMPIALIDVLASHQLKEGILTAYVYKLQTGKGSRITVSLYDAALASLMNQASNYLMSDIVPQLQGSFHPNIAPYGETFQTLDGKYILLAIASDSQFESFCHVFELSDILLLHTTKNDDTVSYRTNSDRVLNRTKLGKLIGKRIQKKTAQEWHHEFNKRHIPHGIVKNLKEVLSEEQAQDLIVKETIDGIETQRIRNTIFKHYPDM